MPNWCWTSYVAVGDKKDIRDLYKKMKSLEDSEKSLIENGFGNTWLGNLVTILGGDYHKISCRASSAIFRSTTTIQSSVSTL